MAHAEIVDEALNPDTQAILLLCAMFSRDEGREPRRLTLREYNAVANCLAKEGRRPADLLESSGGSLPSDESGLPETERIRALLGRGLQLATAVEQWHRLGIWIVSRAEQHYPERLRRQLGPAAPVLLFGVGDASRLDKSGLAIVGSRAGEEESLEFARLVAERCATAGVQVVSGGARGVDQTSVAAALEAEGGALVVLADRLDRAATARDAREPLRQGKVTLVSPFEPESIFQVGRAMERNKVIYAFADAALVVRFAGGEGGTWNGAIEQLGRNKSGRGFVPVYVRVAGNPEEGCRQLLARGALAFPEERFREIDMAELLNPPATGTPELFDESAGAPSSVADGRDPQAAPDVSEAPTPAAPAAVDVPATSPSGTCYELCLPLILEQLRTEPTERQLGDVARRLEMQPRQLKDWLKRAIEQGRVSKVKKRGRSVYVAQSPAKDSALFERDGDAA